LPIPATEPGRVGALRPRHRERESAGVHHTVAAPEQWRAGELRRVVPARYVSGDEDRPRRLRRRWTGRATASREPEEPEAIVQRPARATRLRAGVESQRARCR